MCTESVSFMHMDFNSWRNALPQLIPPDYTTGIGFIFGHAQSRRIFGICRSDVLYRWLTQQMVTPDVSPFSSACSSPPPSVQDILPVNQSIICCAVVLNLVHSDARDVALRWPPDHSRGGGQLGDHHPPVLLVVALGVIARFGGGGDV